MANYWFEVGFAAVVYLYWLWFLCRGPLGDT